jgi:pyruvate ferredoxin oxidoreductase beta subunit
MINEMSKTLKIMDIPDEEFINPGTRACAGCGMSIVYRMALKALGAKTIAAVPASCLTVLHGMQGFTPVKIPYINTCFETVAASASGIAASLKNQGLDKEITVLAIAGDGGTVDIGLQGLSGAAERGTDIIYACYDNEAYMNTGVQRSGSTPFGAYTTTTPINGKIEHKKNMSMIMEAHSLPYIATACSSYPQDIYEKFLKAKAMRGKGLRYLHILAPCSPGWGFETSQTIEIGRLAVKSGFWPMFEITEGKFELSKPSKLLVDPSKRIPVEDYLKVQGRFKKLTDEGRVEVKEYVNSLWTNIQKRLECK